MPTAGVVSDHQAMFKTTFRDANGNIIDGPPFMPVIPAQGEAVNIRQNATWKEINGVVTKRAWFLHADEPDSCEVVLYIALDTKKR